MKRMGPLVRTLLMILLVVGVAIRVRNNEPSNPYRQPPPKEVITVSARGDPNAEVVRIQKALGISDEVFWDQPVKTDLLPIKPVIRPKWISVISVSNVLLTSTRESSISIQLCSEGNQNQTANFIKALQKLAPIKVFLGCVQEGKIMILLPRDTPLSEN